MIGVIVTFDYSGDFDRERVIKVPEGGHPGRRAETNSHNSNQS